MLPIRLIVFDIDGVLTAGETAPLDFDLMMYLSAMNRAAREDPSRPAVTLCTGRPAPFVEAFAQAINGHLPAIFENGCGLSRVERITVTTLADVLTDSWKGQWMSELMSSLPISGVDGTMKGRNVPSGAAHMKTGLLEDTRAVAGYVLAASGKRYVVVAIINHANASRGTGAHDALIDWVYRAG